MTEHTRTAVMTAPTRDTHANWTANNPILPEGVLGVVFSRLYSGSVEFFVGDGTHTYAELEKSGDVLSGYVTNTALEAKGFLKENNLTVQTVQNVVEQVQDLGSISSAVALNPAAGNIIKATVAGAVTFTLNAAETGCRVLTLMLTNAGAYTITWPAAVKWPGGDAPTFEATGTSLVNLVVHGGVVYGADLGNYPA